MAKTYRAKIHRYALRKFPLSKSIASAYIASLDELKENGFNIRSVRQMQAHNALPNANDDVYISGYRETQYTSNAYLDCRQALRILKNQIINMHWGTGNDCQSLYIFGNFSNEQLAPLAEIYNLEIETHRIIIKAKTK